MIKDLKDFEKMLKICRKHGVDEVNLQDLTVKFGDLPSTNSPVDEETPEEIPTGALTPEQLMYYSAIGGEA